MSVNRTLVALGVLAAIMLVSCDQSIGSSNSDVRVATTQTTYCYVHENQSLTGHIDWFQTNQMSSYYVRSTPLITRGYTDSAGLAHPLTNGFCTFVVPYFESSGGAPVCSLFYYQSSYSGSADLRVNWLYSITLWDPGDEALFWAAWDDTLIVATDVAQSTNGWHAVPLTAAGCAVVEELAADGPKNMIAGWTYRGFVSGTHADVTGSGANAPYIKVVYDDGQWCLRDGRQR